MSIFPRSLLAVTWLALFTFHCDAAPPEKPARLLEGNHVSELLEGPAAPAEHEAWLRGMKTWRVEQRKLLGPVIAELGDPYSLPQFEWTRTDFVQPQMMAHDRFFFDPQQQRYTVDRYLGDLEARYGGIDSVLVWPTYPNMGIDDRNQYDLWRDMPGGLAGVRQMVEDFHRRHVRVFIPIMYWDHGTRDEGASMPEALAQLAKEINADGLNGDTMSGVSRDFYDASVAIGHPLVMEPENGIADPTGLVWNTMSWGYWWPYQQIPPINKFRWLESRHMTHVCDRWSHNRNDLLQLAFFNGAGHQSWENVWGIWNGVTPKDGETIRRIRMIYKAVPEFLSSPDYIPHYPTLQTGVFATRFPLGDGSLTTMINQTTSTVSGKQLTLPAGDSTRYFNLWTGKELHPDIIGTSATVSFKIEAEGFAAVLAMADTSTTVTQLLADMRKRSNVPPSALSSEWQIMKQQIVPIEKTKPVPQGQAPEGMIAIPAGRYLFEVKGVMVEKNEGNDFQYPWEDRPELKHRHEMDVDAFYIDKYPVSCAQFQQFLEAANYRPADDHNFLRDWNSRKHPAGWDKKPVTWVALEDARAYAAWAGKRLPHEWEWQYAAQGTDHRKYPWGDDKKAKAMPPFANGRVQPLRADVDAHPQGGSPFGVMDMVGNVWQWTDEYKDVHTRAAVLRGGSSYRPSGSNWYFPQAHELNTHGKYLLMAPSLDRSASLGFRCVVDAATAEK